eukprot:CAMPEP_0172597830 /NCGR_PEP_ID=MMETSP1068-20121228/17801_1 /TAXON_ID=35684 /ORGANISM="Pseudopedinella elastica, Strain CCMP716" /LENGTH=71 /DNA_ID=CAMNT_0013397447 /DNA_START=617 /DNA_END=832 /DNA_ORIENTATION=+
MGAVPAALTAFFWLTCRMATPNLPPPGARAKRTCLSFSLPHMKGPAFDLRATHARARTDPQHRLLNHTGEY